MSVQSQKGQPIWLHPYKARVNSSVYQPLETSQIPPRSHSSSDFDGHLNMVEIVESVGKQSTFKENFQAK